MCLLETEVSLSESLSDIAAEDTNETKINKKLIRVQFHSIL